MGTRELSDTAYLICWGRSMYPELSEDNYASHWLTTEGIEFSKKFTEFVTPLAPYLFSLRSRYLIELLRDFEQKHHGFTLLNVGSGITSYPFILSERTSVINIDQPHVLEVYKERAKELISSGLLPNRNIICASADLNTEDGLTSILKILSDLKQPSFVLFEGILTYLEKELALKLISECSKALTKGSRMIVHVALDNFSIMPAWKRVEEFFITRLGLQVLKLTSFDEKEILLSTNMRLIEHVGFKDIAKSFNKDAHIPNDQLIDERFFLFEKS